MNKIAVVYHSGFGHTEALAHEVAAGARAIGATATLVTIASGQTDFDQAFATIEAADAVVFGSPTYMGTVSAPFKAFMDASVKPYFVQAWRDKLAAGFTNSGSPSGDKLNTLTTLAVFAAQHVMLWVGAAVPPGNNDDESAATDRENRLGSYLGAMAQSANTSPDVSPKTGDRATARALGARIADAARRWTGEALAA